MKYIDADKLIAEIKRQIEEEKNNITDDTKPYYGARQQVRSKFLALIDSLQQEQPEVDLEKFTQKMNDWKARYNHPDDIPIKGTMAFTARMFYQYPNVARQWYDSLPKATLTNARKEDNNEKV